jgi:hypothetical protein
MDHLNNFIIAIRALLSSNIDTNNPINPEAIEEIIKICEPSLPAPLTEEEREYIRFTIHSQFTIDLAHKGTVLGNPDVKRWLDNAKTDIEWTYWNAFRDYLANDQQRAEKVIQENEKIIDNILDYSGDPRIEGSWSRKGLVMGNVQSGKTQNYLGLINKAMDSGYKIIILLGGHMNDLRKQTQQRVDEGVIGRESTHIVQANLGVQNRIGVGKYRTQEVATVTSTIGDFNRNTANNLGITLNNLSDPIIFTVKKNTSIMRNLYEWIKTKHMLDPEDGKKLDLPLLLIDDEADFASVNTKAHRDDITATNKYIRQIIGLFNRSTYVAYTATPFANIFIDPETTDEMYGNDLFPSDFMIRVPVPDNYLGQNFYFENQDYEEISPVVIVDDNEKMIPVKHNSSTMVGPLTSSMKDSIRAFIISCSLRDSRGHEKNHKTMMINITHLNALQGQLTPMIDDYLKELKNSVDNIIGYELSDAINNSSIKSFHETFISKFDVDESFEDVLINIRKAIHKIKVYGINTQTKQVLDYSIYPDGLSAIVIGGHKLSRGLTLEGLSISYFARNSKAYDTLMQMCRWFGYRPNYGDLCKVYLPIESNEWYTFIAEAVNELYEELEIMSMQEKTPKDFGLKVRDHQGSLIVTARTKMETAQNSIISIDMWGQRQRRHRFYNDKDINKNNLELTERFYKKITSDKETQVMNDNNSLLIEGVKHKDIIEYIEEMALKEDDLGDKALINHIKTMRDNNLPDFKVLVKSIESSNRQLKWSQYEPEKDLVMLKDYDFCGHKINLQKRNFKSNGSLLFFPSAEAGSGTDEKAFISNSSYKDIVERRSNAQNFQFIRSVERDFPAMIIYMFSLAIVEPYSSQDWSEENISVQIPFDQPTVGLSISFPVLENDQNLSPAEMRALNNSSKVSYQTNQVYRQQILPFHMEDEYLENE